MYKVREGLEAQTGTIALDGMNETKDRTQQFLIFRISLESNQSFFHCSQVFCGLDQKRLIDALKVCFQNVDFHRVHAAVQFFRENHPGPTLAYNPRPLTELAQGGILGAIAPKTIAFTKT